MAERKATNKYYPPDWHPGKGSLNTYHNTHALRERAKKLDEGILIIRFEMPFNIWCNGCGNHIGMGVRYNAQKLRVGFYFTTAIYKFTMKCHLCPQKFEIQTDPQNSDYTILSGARRKEARWDTKDSGTVELMEYDEKIQLHNDPMFKLEHQTQDKQKITDLQPTFDGLLRYQNSRWEDPYSINSRLRTQFRKEKTELKHIKSNEKLYKTQHNLHRSIKLVDENPSDVILSNGVPFKRDEKYISSLKSVKSHVKRSNLFDDKNKSQPLSVNAKKLLNNFSIKKTGKSNKNL